MASYFTLYLGVSLINPLESITFVFAGLDFESPASTAFTTPARLCLFY